MLVRIEKDWDHPDIFRQCPGGTRRWGGVDFTTDPVDECDLLVVLNGPVRDIRVRCPAGARWLFTQESPVEMYRWQTDSFPHFDRLFTFWTAEAGSRLADDHSGLPWQIGRSYDELQALSASPDGGGKLDRLSWVTSSASHKPGHKLRLDFLEHLRRSDLEFDLFGRGFSPIGDKFDGVHPYKYSLAIENYGCDNYWTEKIADCFLCWTVPVYWGATNIERYFPADSMIRIDPHDPARAIAIIREAIEGDFYARHFDALREARERVLQRLQFFPHIVGLIERHGLKAGAPRERVSIPTNPFYYHHEPALRRLRRALRSGLGEAMWRLR